MGIFDFLRGKKAGNGAGAGQDQADGDHITRHCFVLCKDAQAPDPGRASRIVARVFGPGYSALVQDGSIVTVGRGDDAVGMLAHMPLPIPEGEAERYAEGNVLWPDGEAEVAEHTSHVIVTNICGGEQSALDSAIEVSRLALVALELFNGLGVYWGNGNVCHSRSIFEGFCEDMSEHHVPVAMWLRLQPVAISEGEIGLYTLGMQQFGLMDLEVERCRLPLGELVQFVSGVAQYLVQNGPVIKDGDTVGGSETERIKVHHRPSLSQPPRPVYKIVLES